MQSNEIRILREFILEFNPFFTMEMLTGMSYDELVDEVKNITEEM